MLAAAMSQVRLRVEPHTWQAFQLTAIEGVSGADAASRLQLPIASIYQAKSRVQKLLQEEVERLDSGGM